MIQKLKAAFDADDRAVSPVIGVILMVAITVILAAVIASMTLGLGDSAQTTPQAKLDTNYNQDFVAGTSSDTLELSHGAGATIPADQLSVVVTGAERNDGSTTTSVSLDAANIGDKDNVVTWKEIVAANGGSITDVSAGNSITVDAARFDNSGSGELDLSGANVKVIWTSEDGGSSDTIATWSA